MTPRGEPLDHPEVEPPPELLEQARAYIATQEWIFAKTMPENPHWYAVRQRAWAVSEEMGQGHEALFSLIRNHHYLSHWHGRSYRSIDLDGFSYWILRDGTVINRVPST